MRKFDVADKKKGGKESKKKTTENVPLERKDNGKKSPLSVHRTSVHKTSTVIKETEMNSREQPKSKTRSETVKEKEKSNKTTASTASYQQSHTTQPSMQTANRTKPSLETSGSPSSHVTSSGLSSNVNSSDRSNPHGGFPQSLSADSGIGSPTDASYVQLTKVIDRKHNDSDNIDEEDESRGQESTRTDIKGTSLSTSNRGDIKDANVTSALSTDVSDSLSTSKETTKGKETSSLNVASVASKISTFQSKDSTSSKPQQTSKQNISSSKSTHESKTSKEHNFPKDACSDEQSICISETSNKTKENNEDERSSKDQSVPSKAETKTTNKKSNISNKPSSAVHSCSSLDENKQPHEQCGLSSERICRSQTDKGNRAVPPSDSQNLTVESRTPLYDSLTENTCGSPNFYLEPVDNNADRPGVVEESGCGKKSEDEGRMPKECESETGASAETGLDRDHDALSGTHAQTSGSGGDDCPSDEPSLQSRGQGTDNSAETRRAETGLVALDSSSSVTSSAGETRKICFKDDVVDNRDKISGPGLKNPEDIENIPDTIPVKPKRNKPTFKDLDLTKVIAQDPNGTNNKQIKGILKTRSSPNLSPRVEKHVTAIVTTDDVSKPQLQPLQKRSEEGQLLDKSSNGNTPLGVSRTVSFKKTHTKNTFSYYNAAFEGEIITEPSKRPSLADVVSNIMRQNSIIELEEDNSHPYGRDSSYTDLMTGKRRIDTYSMDAGKMIVWLALAIMIVSLAGGIIFMSETYNANRRDDSYFDDQTTSTNRYR